MYFALIINKLLKMEKVRILNIDLISTSKSDLLKKMKTGIFMPVNVDMIIKFQTNEMFYHAYKNSNIVVCDSKIIYICLFLLNQPIKEVIRGSSFFSDFYSYHKNNSDVRIFLLGAAPGVAQQAMDNINEKIGRDIIVGAHSPSFGFENNDQECSEIIELINNTNATVLAIGVGAPKQEIWIEKNKLKFTNINLFMSLGATIDFEAGNVKRAPLLIQKLGLEWLFRLINEPKRLWKRYLVDDLPFFYYVLKQRFGWYVNPFEEKI